MVCFGLVSGHFNHCSLFNVKCFLDIYIKYMISGWLVGWLDFMAYRPL